MKNKLFKTTAFIVPLVSLPVFMVASCSNQTNLPQGDQIKAMQNIKISLQDFKNVFQAWLPSEVKLPGVNGRGISLPKLDPRQNFGYVTTFSSVTDGDNDQKGTKKVRVQITRGQESYNQTIELSGFLTKEQQDNETKNEKLNPEKRFNGFNRLTNPIVKVSLNQEDRVALNDFLSRNNPATLIEKYEKNILKSNNLVNPQESEQEPNFSQIEIANIIQAKQHNIPVEFVDAEIRLIIGQGLAKQTSGTYTLRLVGFDPKQSNLRTAAALEKNIEEFATFNTPVKAGSNQQPYLPIRASELKVNDLRALLERLDHDFLTTHNVLATLKSFANPNDTEGSIEAEFDFSYPGFNGTDDPKITKTVKLYGFRIISVKK